MVWESLPYFRCDSRITGENEVLVLADKHQLVQVGNQVSDKRVDLLLSVVLKLFFGPTAAGAVAMLRKLFPNVVNHGSNVQAEQLDAVFITKRDRIPVIGILKLQQVIDTGSSVHGQPVRQ